MPNNNIIYVSDIFYMYGPEPSNEGLYNVFTISMFLVIDEIGYFLTIAPKLARCKLYSSGL